MITKTTEMAEDTYNISLITYFEFAFYIAELLIWIFCPYLIFLFLFCPWFWAIAFFPVILRVIAKFYNWVYDT